MSLSLFINRQFINYMNKIYHRHKGLKVTNSIPRHKLSFSILIQFLIIEDIFPYPKN